MRLIHNGTPNAHHYIIHAQHMFECVHWQGVTDAAFADWLIVVAWKGQNATKLWGNSSKWGQRRQFCQFHDKWFISSQLILADKLLKTVIYAVRHWIEVLTVCACWCVHNLHLHGCKLFLLYFFYMQLHKSWYKSIWFILNVLFPPLKIDFCLRHKVAGEISFRSCNLRHIPSFPHANNLQALPSCIMQTMPKPIPMSHVT